jgi:cytochrome c5
MSDAHNEHQSVIRTPKQLVAAVAAGFLVPIISIVLLVQYVANADKVGAGSDSMTSEAIAARLRPVADEGFTLKDANAPKQLQAGDAVYKATCAACHDTGAAGAPKLGDNGAWAARLGKGQATVVGNAIKGIKAMPAKGGNPDLDDIEVERAVVYLVNKSGGNLKEPAVKAAAAPAEPAKADAGAAKADGK